MAKPQNRRTRRGQLSRERVLAEAMKLADAEGLQALTMRRIASALEVDPMALYRHVKSRDALLDGLVEQLWREVPMPNRDSDDWVGPLRSYAQDVRSAIDAHPGVASLLLTRCTLTTPSLEAAKILLQNLRDAGFDDQRAGKILRAVNGAALGGAIWRIAYLTLTGTSVDELPDETEQLVLLARMLPDDAPPGHVRAALAMCGCEADDDTFALDLLLDGAASLQRATTGAG